MGYVKVEKTTDFLNKNKIKLSLEGKDILIAKINEEYFAIDNRCNHLGGSLVEGRLEGNSIICPKHGSVFDVKTGKVEARGKLFFLKVNVKDQKTYPVKLDGTDISIEVD